ncbi:MAG: OsmC family protein [Aggregatilineaceae bacterium]
MAIRKASALWEGSLREGKGTMRLGSGAFEGAYSFGTRFEEEPGTNPEELIGAAHAGCFSMAFSANLGRAGYTPDYVRTTADVHLEKVDGGFKITRIVLHMEARVPGLDEKTFLEQAEAAKSGCPVSQALAAVPIELDARLVS